MSRAIENLTRRDFFKIAGGSVGTLIGVTAMYQGLRDTAAQGTKRIGLEHALGQIQNKIDDPTATTQDLQTRKSVRQELQKVDQEAGSAAATGFGGAVATAGGLYLALKPLFK